MNEWPTDADISRLYQQMPLPEASPALRVRVMEEARRHADSLRAAKQPQQLGKRDEHRAHAWWRNWWMPAGAFASLAVVFVTLVQFRQDGDMGQNAPADRVVMAANDSQKTVVPVETHDVKLPQDIRLAEVEPGNSPAVQVAAAPIEADPVRQAAPGMAAESSFEKELPPILTTEQQIAELRRLKQHGEWAAYKKQRELFLQRHPNSMLPEDLRH